MSSLKQKIVTITPKRAAELLTFNTFEGQRALRPKHAAMLGEKMTDGRFKTASRTMRNRLRNRGGNLQRRQTLQRQAIACAHCFRNYLFVPGLGAAFGYLEGGSPAGSGNDLRVRSGNVKQEEPRDSRAALLFAVFATVTTDRRWLRYLAANFDFGLFIKL